jgi:hypothetical protein
VEDIITPGFVYGGGVAFKLCILTPRFTVRQAEQPEHAAPTVKLSLAAIRHLFDVGFPMNRTRPTEHWRSKCGKKLASKEFQIVTKLREFK